jgi:hypothetical protein
MGVEYHDIFSLGWNITNYFTTQCIESRDQSDNNIIYSAIQNMGLHYKLLVCSAILSNPAKLEYHQ